MSKYAKKLTREDLIKAGIKDIYFSPRDLKYHIIDKNDKEISLCRNNQDYIYFNIYDLDENGQYIKVPIKRKFKGCTKDSNTYIYKMKTITLHRAIWAWFKGEVPEGMIVDHINNKHDTYYDNRPENLQLLTPAENLAKERPISMNIIRCNMKKPIEYYTDKLNYWLLEYKREKEERSSSTKYAHKCRAFYSVYKKKIRYWYQHEQEYKNNEKLEKARTFAREYQQERISKIKWFKNKINEAKEKGDKEQWHKIVDDYNHYLKLKPFKAAKELINDYILYIADNKSAKVLM